MNRIAVGTRSALLAVAATISIVSATWLPARVLAEQNDRGKDEIPGARGLPEMNPALLQTPLTEPIDISAQPAPGNRLAACGACNQRSFCSGNYRADLYVLCCATTHTRGVGNSAATRISGPLRRGVHRNRHVSCLLVRVENPRT